MRETLQDSKLVEVNKLNTSLSFKLAHFPFVYWRSLFNCIWSCYALKELILCYLAAAIGRASLPFWYIFLIWEDSAFSTQLTVFDATRIYRKMF